MPTTTAADAYLICATPRTGSSLLCGLLDSTGVAGHPEAYFRLPNERDWADQWGIADQAGDYAYTDFVRAAVAVGRTDNGVFGAKVMWGSLDPIVDRLAVAHPDLAGADLDLLQRAFGETRFVFVRRADLVAQAVSRLRAEQTDHWYIGDTSIPGRQPEYDFAGIHGYVQEIEEHNRAWQDWFDSAGVRPHSVWYEDLTADLAGVTQGILDHLGVHLPADRTIAPRHQRQADELSRDWIARYHAALLPSDATTPPLRAAPGQ